MEVSDQLEKLSRGLPPFLLHPPASSPPLCGVCRSSPAPHHFDNPGEVVSLLLCLSSSEFPPTPPGDHPPAFLCKSCQPQVATLLRLYDGLTDILGKFHATRTRLTHSLTYACADDLKLPPSVADAAFFEWKCSLGTHLHLERGSFKGLMHPVLRPGKRRCDSVGTQTGVPAKKAKKQENGGKKREGEILKKEELSVPQKQAETSSKTLTPPKITRKKKPPPPPPPKKRPSVRRKTSPKKKPPKEAPTSPKIGEIGETVETQVKGEVPLPPKKRVKLKKPSVPPSSNSKPSQPVDSLPATVKCLDPNCPVKFTSFSRMLTHVIRKHDNNVPFQCDTCPKILATRKDLIAHRRVHGIEKLYECKSCGGKFENPRSLKTHETSHSGLTFPCEVCDKLCPSRSHLQKHMRTHTQFQTCPLCPTATFTIPARFRRHNFLQHPLPSGKTCHVCYLHFEEDAAYETHMAAHDHLKCPYCHKIFNAKNTLERHKLIHENKLPYPCTHCNKSFRSSWRLTVHTYCHTGAHPFVCDQCGKRFPVGNVLKKHMKSAHPSTKDVEKE